MQRQRERKKKIELWTCSTLYYHFFAVFLHYYNEKLPSYTFYGGNVVHCMCFCFFFFFFSLPLIFILVAASMSHILTAAIKFSCLSSK